VPEHESSMGREVVDLAAAAGLILDEWQQLCVMGAMAEDPFGFWLCFEIAIIVSRQNGKGSILEALELAWLFLFGDKLIIHSAHLFETSREHFLRMQALITNHDDFRRRVKRMREGRGSEEIELYGPRGSMHTGGQRLKFMTRKGGAGRGFTGNKTVMDEAMYLDAVMMAAMLPTMATIDNAQIVYTGSAGMKHSTQLALVRRRAYARNDPALMLAEWAADKPVYDPETGLVVDGDDPEDPRTWAKTNPTFNRRITVAYIRKEMAALGGPASPAFWQERLGIGDYPEEDETWEVIDKLAWEAAADPGSRILAGPGGRQTVAFAIDADPDRSMGTIGVAGRRADGRGHIEVVERHRGTGWIVEALAAVQPDNERRAGLPEWQRTIVDRMTEFGSKYRICAVVVLKTAATGSLIDALVKAGLPVESPSEIEYAQACGSLYEAVKEKDSVRHLGQPSMNTAVGGGRKRESAEGGWRWSRGGSSDPAPIVVGTLALWALGKFGSRGRGPAVFDDSILTGVELPADAVVNRGAAGFHRAMHASAGRP